MLLELNIRNIALIERLRIGFMPGLNVLTGETGAGKSIVIDSVNLALGGRADRELIRSGADRASVQAVFDVRGNERALALLDEWGMEAEDGYLTVGRELSSGGRNLCRVGGEVATLAQIRQLTALLVELHGQHEHQELMSPSRHMAILDAFGDERHRALMRRVQELYAEYTAVKGELDALSAELRERAFTMDVLERQVEEIRALKIKEGEDEKLEKQFRLMENAEKISSGVEKAYHLVYAGGERAPSVQEALRRAALAMSSIADIDERFADMSRRLDEMFYAAQDAGYELQDMMEGLEFDPAAFDRTGARLDALEKLKDKYGPTLKDVIAFRDASEARLAALRQGDERMAELKEKLADADGRMMAACVELTASRRALAAVFEKNVTAQLAELGMSKVRFQTRFLIPEQDKRRLSPQGADQVEFLISPNPGEPLKPLSSTASGGELSRVMLAIKAVMAEREQVGTMIFDEIDTGVSGRMAQVVGEKMSGIARHRQVIAVSHLPQIAALGDAHFLVEKSVSGGRTGSSVRLLDDEGRVMELARMVGGAGDPESGIQHARNMLSAAQALKEKRS
ncbi:MAG: DNA repair protein RecN [Clostridia bacterium]|nr:DNA repair protein RecN [Clostridia bacterium]